MSADGDAEHQTRAFRHVSPGHDDVGEGALQGSRRTGGRFNPPGDFGAVYLSFEKETAVAELRRRARRSAVRIGELLPRVLLVVESELQKVLDLTDDETRRHWGLDGEDLVSGDYRACQDVGRAARRAGYEAVLYPSAARDGGRNLAVFVDRLRPGSRLEIVDRRSLEIE